MEILNVVFDTMLPILLAYVAYNERDKHAMKNKYNDNISEGELYKHVELTTKVLDVRLEKIEEDIIRLETKIDRVMDKLL